MFGSGIGSEMANAGTGGGTGALPGGPAGIPAGNGPSGGNAAASAPGTSLKPGELGSGQPHDTGLPFGQAIAGAATPPVASGASAGGNPSGAPAPGGATGSSPGLVAPAIVPGLPGSGSGGQPGTAAGVASGPSGTSGQNTVAGTPGTASGEGTPGTSANRGAIANGSPGGDPGSGSGGNLLNRLAPPDFEKHPLPRPAPVRPGRQFADRDWTIQLECTADAVVLLPSRQSIAATALPRRSDPENALAQAVRKMIERRQALVPSGEPPYRPRLLFLVRPEGLRTYYLAYPALDSLQLPMTRQDVRQEDENRK